MGWKRLNWKIKRRVKVTEIFPDAPPVIRPSCRPLKLATITMHRSPQERKLATPNILQMHDELVLEASEAEVDEVSALVRDTMQNAFQLSVPLRVDVGIGQTWG